MSLWLAVAAAPDPLVAAWQPADSRDWQPAGCFPTPSAGAASVADAAAPKPPKDNSRPAADTVMPKNHSCQWLRAPWCQSGKMAHQQKSLQQLPPSHPRLPSTASRAPGFARKPLCNSNSLQLNFLGSDYS